MQYLKIQQLSLASVLLFLFLMNGQAQLKNYTLTDKGDTINGYNQKGEKHGKWIIQVAELRGEEGYEEEGEFKNGKKEGVWKLFSTSGDLIGVENYRFGGKDGTQQYFTYLGDLIRIENWRGYNPDAPYDTIDIYGTGSDEIIDRKIVKAEQYSVKHGEWKYFEPGTGRLIKTEKYDRGFLEKPKTAPATAASTQKDPAKKPDKTPEMLEWEKKNKGKKKVLRDGRTGM